jgi:hypothetical protein
MLVCLTEFKVQTVHYVIVGAEIWCPHREEIVVLAIFSALSVNGGKLTKKNLKGVGEIHQGKRFQSVCSSTIVGTKKN